MNKLDEYCLNVTDGEHGSIKDDSCGQYFFLNNNNITDFGISISEDDRRMSFSDFCAIRKRTKLAAGDLVIATCGTLGKTQIIREDPTNYEFSRSVGIVKPDPEKLSVEYLHYYFCLGSSQKRIQQLAKGGVQKHFYIDDIKEFEVDFPVLKTQLNVAELLSSIDQSIRILTKQQAILRSTATLIYDYWFTQFDFPDAERRPFRASGGEMVYSEVLKRDIPKGWRAGKINDLIEGIRTGLNPRKNFCLQDQGIAYLTVKNLATNGRIDFSNTDFINKEARKIVHRRSDISRGDILFASISPLRRCYLIMEDPESWDINESVFSIRPDSSTVSPEFLYCYFMSDQFVKAAESSSAGSIFKGIRNETLRELPAVVPPVGIAKAFGDEVRGIFTLSHSIEKQTHELQELRNWLLPMLMNGQVTLKD